MGHNKGGHNKRFVKIAVGLAFLVIGLFPCLALAQAAVALEADDQYQFAESYFHRGEYFRAVGEYERFIHFFPQDERVAPAMFKIGESYFKGEQFRQAISAFEAVIDAYPGTDLEIRAYFMIGDSHVQAGHFAGALLVLDNLLRLTQDPDVKDEIYYRQGWIYLDMDQWEKAETFFEKISSKNREIYRLKDLSEDLNKKKDLKLKNPRAAGALAVIPGAGHLYVGRYQDAFVAFLLNGVMIWGAVEAFDNDNEGLGALLTLFEIGFYSGNIYSAVSSAHKHNRRRKEGFLQYLKDHSKVRLSARPAYRGYTTALSCEISF
jgi:TolA-binding protein